MPEDARLPRFIAPPRRLAGHGRVGLAASLGQKRPTPKGRRNFARASGEAGLPVGWATLSACLLVTQTIPIGVDVREHKADGTSPFGEWFAELDAHAAAKITIVVMRLGQGNLSKVKGVGSGVFEYVADFGPGYRVYFGKDGDEIVILLGGGTKNRQQRDIDAAKSCWEDYKRRKKGRP